VGHDAPFGRHEGRIGEDHVGVIIPTILTGKSIILIDMRVSEAMQVEVHQAQSHHVGRDVVALEVLREASLVIGREKVASALRCPLTPALSREGRGRRIGLEDVLVGRDQEARSATGRVKHGIGLLRIDDLDHEVDDVARGAELTGIALRAEHGEQIFEGVAEALRMVVVELVNDLEEHLERFRVAVGKIGVFEDIAEERRNARVLRHFDNGFGVKVQDLVSAQTCAHEFGPAIAGKIITKGTTPTTAGFSFEDSGVNFIKIESVADDGTIIASKVAHISKDAHVALARSQLEAGDVLFSIAGAMGRSTVVDSYLLPANTNQALAIIRVKAELISPVYLSHILRSSMILAHVESVKAGVAQYNVSLQQVGDIEIPLPPLVVQKEIVSEIEGYQKVINGARAVLDNYHPNIPIHPDWPIPTFDAAPFQIIDGDRGTNYPSKEDFSPSGHCLFLNTKNVRSDGFKFDEMEFISADKDRTLRKGKLERGDVLLTTRGTIGNTALYDASVEFEHIRINSGMLIFRPDTAKLSASYLFHFFQSENFRAQREAIVSGAAQPQLPIRSLNEATIPLPPLDTQQTIVAEIEAEKVLVAANRELITRFEKKIQATLARVWGEDEPDPAEV